MATSHPTYHAPTFEPTVDEIEALKQLELGHVSVPEALRHHLSGRLLEWGLVAKVSADELAITEAGRQIIRRQDN